MALTSLKGAIISREPQDVSRGWHGLPEIPCHSPCVAEPPAGPVARLFIRLALALMLALGLGTPAAAVAPTVNSAVVAVTAPKELAITFSEALDTTSVPAASAFTVKVGGTAEDTPKKVSISGAVVTLTLATALDNSQTSVTIDYTNPGSSNDPLKNAANEEVATFTNQAVTNNAPACPSGQPADAFWTACLRVGVRIVTESMVEYTWYGLNASGETRDGSLSDTTFTRDITTYTIDMLRTDLDNSHLELSFGANPGTAADSWILQVGGATFRFNLNDRSSFDAATHTYRWNRADIPMSKLLNWEGSNIGDKVSVSLMQDNSPATGLVINGVAEVGETLEADVSGIADSDGLTTSVYSYQWMRWDDDTGTTSVEVGTDSTYTLVGDDNGKYIAVKVSFTDDASNPEELTVATADAVSRPVREIDFSAREYDTRESDGDLTVTVEIKDGDGNPATLRQNVTLRVVTSDHTTDADDYTVVNSPVTIPAGQSSVDVTVRITQDNSVERQTEQVNLTLEWEGGSAPVFDIEDVTLSNERSRINIVDSDTSRITLMPEVYDVAEGDTVDVIVSRSADVFFEYTLTWRLDNTNDLVFVDNTSTTALPVMYPPGPATQATTLRADVNAVTDGMRMEEVEVRVDGNSLRFQDAVEIGRRDGPLADRYIIKAMIRIWEPLAAETLLVSVYDQTDKATVTWDLPDQPDVVNIETWKFQKEVSGTWTDYKTATTPFSSYVGDGSASAPYVDFGDKVRVVLVTDTGAEAISDVFTIPNNTPPVVAIPIPDQTAMVAQTFSYTVPVDTFTDQETTTLTYTAKGPGWLSFDPASRVFTGVPDMEGTVEVTVTAFDGSGGGISDAFTITIQPIGLVFSGAPVTVAEGGQATYTVALAVAPVVNVTVTIESGDEGAVTVSPASLTFTPTDWEAKPVTVTGVADDDDADETVTLTHSGTGVQASEVTVTVTDVPPESTLETPRNTMAAIMLRRHVDRFASVSSGAALGRLQGEAPPTTVNAQLSARSHKLDASWTGEGAQDSGWSGWSRLFYGRFDGPGNGDIYDLYLGVDWRAPDGRYVIGGMFGHEGATLRLDDSSGRFRSQISILGVYGATYLSDALILDGALSYGFGRPEVSMGEGDNRVTAKYDTERFTIRADLTGGVSWHDGAVVVRPQMGVLHAREKLGAFTDSKGAPGAAETLRLTRFGVGPRLTWVLPEGVFTGRARVNWDWHNLDGDGDQVSDLSASLDARLRYDLDGGLSAEFFGAADGIGLSGDQQIYTAGVSINFRF